MERVEQTSCSLLERLRRAGAQDDWARFVRLYTPLLFFWSRRMGLQEQDAADLVQEVFVVLVQKLPQFEYDRQRTFRGWLRMVTINKWRQMRRRARLPLEQDEPAPLDSAEAPDDAEAVWEQEYQQHLSRRALELMQAEFEETTWKACWEVVVNGRSPELVAAELGITLGAVYAAKSRVLRRLRQELQGLID